MANTLERQEKSAEFNSELVLLSEFIKNHFPAEAACANMKDAADVLRLTQELLERLWRWEH